MKKLFLVLVLTLCSAPVFAQANLQGDVARARAKYPTPMSAAQQAAVVNEVAWLHRAEGWAVLGKPGGNNCPQPRTGTPLSCDFLVYKPSLSGFDVLSDAEGAGRVQWDGPKPGVQTSQVVEAVEPEGTVEPPPPPPPGDFATKADLVALHLWNEVGASIGETQSTAREARERAAEGAAHRRRPATRSRSCASSSPRRSRSSSC
jgi:hypothetical protein